MIDAKVRQLTGPALDRSGARLAAAGVRAGWVTAAGWLAGVAACVAAASNHWSAALAAWLVNRALDGLDGPVARVTGATRRGAIADLTADFSVYGGFVVGVAIARPDARLAGVCVLAACYVTGTAYVALSSLVERRLAGGIAEGAETVVAYAAVCVAPTHAAVILWIFAALVALTAGQRVITGLVDAGGNDPAANQAATRGDGRRDA